jgi:hypothetical protein
MQQPKLLCAKLRHNEGDAGDVAARPVETSDEAEPNRTKTIGIVVVAALATIAEGLSCAAITAT